MNSSVRLLVNELSQIVDKTNNSEDTKENAACLDKALGIMKMIEVLGYPVDYTVEKHGNFLSITNVTIQNLAW